MADERSPLESEIRRLIVVAGPMPIAEYMRLCLTHPQHGYYINSDPIGASGDFITAPEISQMFGELIGLWMASVWQQMGAPENVRLVELGPGRGTHDGRRTAGGNKVPGFLTRHRAASGRDQPDTAAPAAGADGNARPAGRCGTQRSMTCPAGRASLSPTNSLMPCRFIRPSSAPKAGMSASSKSARAATWPSAPQTNRWRNFEHNAAARIAPIARRLDLRMALGQGGARTWPPRAHGRRGARHRLWPRLVRAGRDPAGRGRPQARRPVALARPTSI